MTWALKLLALLFLISETAAFNGSAAKHAHAYATMMYMGTPRDYEFFVATRVLIRSLSRLRVEADLVVIASVDVPLRWVQYLEEDGARVKRVENLNNPYEKQGNFDQRFKLTMNKLYAWSLVDYDKVVMLDSDNLFLQKTDELFNCGDFCAVFINPCIFHTGLFVLSPSSKVFAEMKLALQNGLENEDGADQGFFGAYFPNLLDAPMFHPGKATSAKGLFRLPLGYQMDATYYYLRLRWNVPCGPNSVVTFPGAVWLKPWYWYSWPVLPLGLQWHEQRRATVGYSTEAPMVVVLVLVFLGVILVAHMARPSVYRLCHRRTERNSLFLQVIVVVSILAAYIVPFFVVPCTVHPFVGWGIYLLGVFAVESMVVSLFMLPGFTVLTLWFGLIGALFVMAYPWYPGGVLRALTIFGYAFCCSPLVWGSFVKVASHLRGSLERDVLSSPKLY